MAFNAPRGTADILPETIGLWQEIESCSRRILQTYGYQEIRTPLFEATELFSRSVGQTSDIVQKQMLTLSAQAGAESEDMAKSEFALRPEGTASVVRAYIENNIASKEGLTKLYYLGPMFRGERPQKGRLRQFNQIGVEVLGPEAGSPYLDAEMIALAVNLLKGFGIADFKLKLNTLGSVADKQNFAEFLKKNLKEDSASLCPDCQRRMEKNIFRVLDCKQEKCRAAVRSLNLNISQYLSAASQEYFAKVKDALTGLKIDFVEDPFLVRGLDYYTNTVFEISCAALGSQDAIGAGGRYDTLLEQLGGDKYRGFGALGFALGIERIILALNEKAATASGIDVFVVALGESAFAPAFLLLQKIRAAGVSADMSYAGGSMKSQMRQANKAGAKRVLILGEDEIKEGVVAVKDMTTGNQEKVGIKEVIKVLSVRC